MSGQTSDEFATLIKHDKVNQEELKMVMEDMQPMANSTTTQKARFAKIREMLEKHRDSDSDDEGEPTSEFYMGESEFNQSLVSSSSNLNQMYPRLAQKDRR